MKVILLLILAAAVLFIVSSFSYLSGIKTGLLAAKELLTEHLEELENNQKDEE